MSTEVVRKDTILVVDDEPVNLSLLLHSLTSAGFEVVVAESGESAIHKAEANLPDLILLDVMMPDLSGFETCRLLKAKVATQDIPVIFMTASAETIDKVQGFSLGAIDYMTKPLQPAEVLARIKTHLNICHLTQQLKEQNARLAQEIQERQRIETERLKLLEQERQARVAYQIAQQEAEAAREHSNTILESIHDAIWDWDLRSNQVRWSQGIYTLFGYATDEVGTTPTWWHDRIHADDRESIVHSIEAVIAQGQHSWTGEYRYRRVDGSYAYVFDRGYLIRSTDGTPIRMVGGMTDMTERKQIQEELQRQNLRSQLFAEVALKIRQSLQLDEVLQASVNEVQRIFQVDRVLILRLFPNAWAKIVTEVVVPPWSSVINCNITDDCFGPQYLQRYGQGRVYMINDVDTASVLPCLIEFLQQFGVKAKLVVPILLKEELWGLLIAHQCSGRREWTNFEIELLQQLSDQIGIALAQAELLEAETRQREELARSNAELQQFAYIASHDLQEPLRMVTSYLQLFARRYQNQLDTNADEFIAYAVDGATRMQALINDLLAYSRVGTRNLPFEAVDCNLVVKQVIRNLQIAIAESQATVTYDSLPTVIGDETQLAQVFQNLISNAIKFRGVALPRVHITASRQNREWCFSVQDNGIGIEPDYADRIFVIFQRLHSRTEYPGTGIGLAICKKIVERHGGRIWIESELGQGTTFHFTIPEPGSTLP
jgi:PAS domain S-box-containing protein